MIPHWYDTPQNTGPNFIANHKAYIGNDATISIRGLCDLNTKVKITTGDTIVLQTLLKSLLASNGMSRPPLFQCVELNNAGTVIMDTSIFHQTTIQWFTNVSPNFTHTFYHSSHDDKLYQAFPTGYLAYSPKWSSPPNIDKLYSTTTMLSFPEQNIISSFQAVEVSHEQKHIKIIGHTGINFHVSTTPAQYTNKLKGLYDSLP